MVDFIGHYIYQRVVDFKSTLLYIEIKIESIALL
jgi:hypothetical protein